MKMINTEQKTFLLVRFFHVVLVLCSFIPIFATATGHEEEEKKEQEGKICRMRIV